MKVRIHLIGIAIANSVVDQGWILGYEYAKIEFILQVFKEIRIYGKAEIKKNDSKGSYSQNQCPLGENPLFLCLSNHMLQCILLLQKIVDTQCGELGYFETL